MNSYDMYDDELTIFRPIFIFRRNKIKLHKDNNYNNINLKFHKKLISYNSQSDLEDLENRIKNFLIIMNKKCDNFNPEIFYKNFNKTWFDLKKLNTKIINGSDGSVRLSPFLNILELKKFSSSYHELLHLSSLKNDKNIYEPFNEGYTQLLEERYFGEASKSYYLMVKAMKIVEIIIGPDALEKLYFSGNFNSLQQIFKEQNPNVNLDTFYNELTLLLRLEHGYNFIKQEDLFKKSLNNVFETLLYCFLNSFSRSIIDEIELLKDYFCFGMQSIKDEKKYVFYSIEETRFYEIVNEYKNKNYKIK